MLKKMLTLMIGIILAFSISACGTKTTSPSPAPTNAGGAAPGTPAQPTGTPAGGNNAGTASPGAGNASPGAPATSPGAGTTTVDAQAVYKQNCVSCHGVNLGGGVGPDLTKVGSRLSADQIATTITNGRNAMPSFKATLKPEEITALSVWLAAKK